MLDFSREKGLQSDVTPCFRESWDHLRNLVVHGYLTMSALRRCKHADPERMGKICELEKAAIEHQAAEKWIEIDRKLDPNWSEEKSKALYHRKEEWLKGCTERLNEARANLHAAEDRDIWSHLGT